MCGFCVVSCATREPPRLPQGRPPPSASIPHARSRLGEPTVPATESTRPRCASCSRAKGLEGRLGAREMRPQAATPRPTGQVAASPRGDTARAPEATRTRVLTAAASALLPLAAPTASRRPLPPLPLARLHRPARRTRTLLASPRTASAPRRPAHRTLSHTPILGPPCAPTTPPTCLRSGASS